MAERTFEFLLNAVERAAQAENPASEGYAEKRRAALEYVAQLEARAPEAKRAIAHGEYLQLLGLFTLAAQHEAAMKSIERAAAQLLDVKEEERRYGHLSDGIYGSRGMDEMLRLLGVVVREG